MTTQQLFEGGHLRFTLPQWKGNPFAYGVLHTTHDGKYLMPWVTVHDVGDWKQNVLITTFGDNLEPLPEHNP